MYAKNKLRRLIAAALLCAAAPSYASLVFVGAVPDTGDGFGKLNTVLTLTNNQLTGLSSGAVSRVGGADFTTGMVAPGAALASTHSFGAMNVRDAADLLFIFNPLEPCGCNDSIWVDALIFSIYADTGGPALFSASLAAPRFFPTSAPGAGNVGFGFALDASQAAMAQAFVSAGNRIGLSAALSLATGGSDTFFVRVLDVPDNPVPEPGSAMLLGITGLGMWMARRRRGAA